MRYRLALFLVSVAVFALIWVNKRDIQPILNGVVLVYGVILLVFISIGGSRQKVQKQAADHVHGHSCGCSHSGQGLGTQPKAKNT